MALAAPICKQLRHRYQVPTRCMSISTLIPQTSSEMGTIYQSHLTEGETEAEKNLSGVAQVEKWWRWGGAQAQGSRSCRPDGPALLSLRAPGELKSKGLRTSETSPASGRRTIFVMCTGQQDGLWGQVQVQAPTLVRD